MRNRLYQIQKSTGKDNHHILFKKVKYEVDCMTKTSYNTYLHSFVGITDETSDTDSSRPNNKKAFLLPQTLQARLLKKDEQLCTYNVQKANLNCQFQSVFTTKSPLHSNSSANKKFRTSKNQVTTIHLNSSANKKFRTSKNQVTTIQKMAPLKLGINAYA